MYSNTIYYNIDEIGGRYAKPNTLDKEKYSIVLFIHEIHKKVELTETE